MRYLNREAAGFEQGLWETIDQTAVRVARSLLTARRFLPVDGPYGVGLTALELGDDGYCRQPGADEAAAVLGRAISVPMLRRSFQLSIRRIEGHRQLGQPLQLKAVMDAAAAIALREEEIIYFGQQEFALYGLFNAQGKSHFRGGDWGNTEQALNDVRAAVDLLDRAGFRGPYALALGPRHYNLLFRHYDGTELLQLEHLRRLCELGVFKAPIEGGVLIDPRLGRIVVGQDLMTGYVAQDGIHHTLYLSESVVLLVEHPGAICTIEPTGPR